MNMDNYIKDEVTIMESIDSLRSASDEIASQYQALLKTFEESNYFKRIPKKTLTIWEKIKNFFSGG